MAEPVELTDAEILALEPGVAEWAAAAQVWLDETDPLVIAVAHIVTARMADAWDEGAYAAGFCCCDPSDNPYRPDGAKADG